MVILRCCPHNLAVVREVCMAWESVKPEMVLADARAQYRAGNRIEQYRISGDAVFLPKEKYIPLDAIKKIQIRKNLMNSGHCCGMGFPVYNLIVFHGGERPAKIMLEKENNARRMAELMTAARSSIVWEEYEAPYSSII